MGLAFGIVYVVLPVAFFGLLALMRRGLPFGMDLFGALHLLRVPVGILALACFGISSWKREDRNWGAVDRAAGSLLMLAGVMVATPFLLW